MTTTTMSYFDTARERLAALQERGKATVLSIETSCDETAAALVKNGRQVLSNAVYTQIPIHRRFGGVVPELASRNHVDQVGPVVESALADAGLTLADVDAIAVTGGPELEKLAQGGDPHAIRFHSAFNEGEGFDMSFSGLKTAVINHLSNARQRGETVDRADVAASFQYAVNTILSDKAVRAAQQNGHGVLALAGGVSANKNLRQMLAEKAARRGIRFCCPDFKYCTDNGAMIGSAAFYLLMKGHIADLSFNAVPYLPIA